MKVKNILFFAICTIKNKLLTMIIIHKLNTILKLVLILVIKKINSIILLYHLVYKLSTLVFR